MVSALCLEQVVWLRGCRCRFTGSVREACRLAGWPRRRLGGALAVKHAADREGYTAGKADFVRSVLDDQSSPGQE